MNPYKSAFYEDYQMEKLSSMLDRFEDELKYTCDWWYLSQFPTQHLFVYDGMKKGMKNHHLLEGGTLEATVFTKSKFTVMKQQMNSLPIPLEKKYFTDPFLSVRGELWNIPSDRFITLDKLRRNGYFFTRKRVVLHVPCRPKLSRALIGPTELHEVKAWMYVGTDSWESLLDGGFEFGRVKHYSPNATWNQPYYNFTELDEKDC